jgi:hypothetical protein
VVDMVKRKETKNKYNSLKTVTLTVTLLNNYMEHNLNINFQ